MAVVELKNVRKTYPSFSLENVTLSAEKGEFVALLGPNGSGKTTLLRLLCGLVPPDAGEIHVDGKALRATSPR